MFPLKTLNLLAMDVVALAKNEGANFRRIHSKLLEWEIEDSGLAPLTAAQEAAINTLTFAMKGVSSQVYLSATAPKLASLSRLIGKIVSKSEALRTAS